ncbi:MAG: threonine synthase, partial [Pseudomonadota bacterium]
FLGAVFEWVLERDARSINIVGATSGDTGSAAIAGVRGKRNINIFIMFPEGRTSATQELQMTTVLDSNVHNLGVIGSFDDCQSMLKETFSDISFKNEYALAAVNSVNWARVLAQVVYYFFAWYRLGQPGQFDVCVPTGNFGNIFAGYIARQMGLPIRRFILATNENDILHRFFSTGVYSREDVRQTHSPAMDIQVSSNLERYLYFLMGRSAERVKRFMKQFASDGCADIPMNTRVLDDCFVSGVADNDNTLRTIREVFQQTGYLLDPHTAVAMHVASTYRDDVPQLVLSTAHPAKFSEAINQSGTPEVGHPTLDQLTELPTRKQVIPADLDFLKNTIRELSQT